MKRCLILTRTNQIAGAEKIVAALAQGLPTSDLKVEVATLFNFKSFLSSYDLIHTHLFLPGLLGRVRRIFDKKFQWVHTVHYGGYESQRWAKLKQFLDQKFIFPEVDKLVAVSRSVTEWLNQNPKLKGRVLTIENSVEGLKRPTEVKFEKSQSQGLVIGTVSMLRAERGLSDLIYAFKRIQTVHPEIQLKIGGDGPERGNLRALIVNLGLQDKVELVGYVSDLSTFLASLDLFVNSSRIESFGMALIEAMSLGLPIVASAVGEIPHLLNQGEYGILVSRSTNQFVEHLAQAMEQGLKSRVELRRASERGYATLLPKLSPERLCRQYRELYLDLLRPGVCMISPIVTHATGGIQKQLLLQSRELVRRGYRVFVLQKFDKDLDLQNPQWSHVQFVQTPAVQGLSLRMSGLVFIVCGFWQVFKIRHRIQVIHAHQLFSPTLIGFAAKFFLGKGLVVKVTASGAYGELNELTRLPFWRLRKLSFKSIDRVIVLTDQMKSEMKEIGFSDERIVLIPNSVVAPPVRAVSSLDPVNVFRILYTGRLSQEKSLETLVAASKMLARRGVECKLTLVGGTYGGRDSTVELRRLAGERCEGLEVIFEGPKASVEKYYESCDVFVLPSLSEGMSNALLEAMSNGLPCVVSDIPANLFVVTHEKDALVFKTANALDLADKLMQLVPGTHRSDLLREKLGAEARRTVESRFSVESIGEKLSSLYTAIGGRGAQL